VRRVLVEQLKAGDRIGRDVYADPGGLPLLKAGIRISESYRQSLKRAGIEVVWVDDRLSQGIEPLEVLSEETKRRATTAIRDAFREAPATLATGQPLNDSTVREIVDVIDQIIEEVAANVHAALALNDLANADGYTLKHSLAVTTLGLSLGVRVMQKYGWLDAQDKLRRDDVTGRLPPLGVGLLVHDIGKLAVPPEILNKPGPLTDEEWTAMRAHPLEGVRILQHASISPLSRAVVRSHHELWNGSGYPAGLTGPKIHQFARVAAVADVFDALTSDRHYRKAWPVHKAWTFIVDGSGTRFDPDVVSVFKSFVAPYPPGTGVTLSDGTSGIVKDVRPETLQQPIVRIVLDAAGAVVTPYEVDLSTSDGLTVASADFDPGTVPVDAEP
jgi:HD-GYP domain-containing protein (c-di-GMP phosphodiesterase class II)